MTSVKMADSNNWSEHESDDVVCVIVDIEKVVLKTTLSTNKQLNAYSLFILCLNDIPGLLNKHLR